MSVYPFGRDRYHVLCPWSALLAHKATGSDATHDPPIETRRSKRVLVAESVRARLLPSTRVPLKGPATPGRPVRLISRFLAARAAAKTCYISGDARHSRHPPQLHAAVRRNCRPVSGAPECAPRRARAAPVAPEGVEWLVLRDLSRTGRQGSWGMSRDNECLTVRRADEMDGCKLWQMMSVWAGLRWVFCRRATRWDRLSGWPPELRWYTWMDDRCHTDMDSQSHPFRTSAKKNNAKYIPNHIYSRGK